MNDATFSILIIALTIAIIILIVVTWLLFSQAHTNDIQFKDLQTKYNSLQHMRVVVTGEHIQMQKIINALEGKK